MPLALVEIIADCEEAGLTNAAAIADSMLSLLLELGDLSLLTASAEQKAAVRAVLAQAA